MAAFIFIMDRTSFLPHDANDQTVMGGLNSADPTKVEPVNVNPVTGGLLVEGTFGALTIPTHDYGEADYPSATQEVYTFYVGGSGGTLVGTLTVNYTDSTKENILNWSLT